MRAGEWKVLFKKRELGIEGEAMAMERNETEARLRKTQLKTTTTGFVSMDEILTPAAAVAFAFAFAFCGAFKNPLSTLL